jgi:hypothetical protein
MTMKTILLSVLFFIVCLGMTAQVPQGFNYQAVVRDPVTGNPVASKLIKVKLSILSDTTGFFASGAGTYVYEEEHTNIRTNSVGVFTVALGAGTKIGGSATSFSSIGWTTVPLYMGVKIAIEPTYSYKNMGSAKLWTVPYAMAAAKADGISSGSKLSVVSSDDATSLALFEVKRKDGQTVFAVYPDAVNVYVPPAAKAGKGGFAIGSFGSAKAPSQDYFRVTKDSVRIYIDDSPVGKGSKGGFAIGGFDKAKAGMVKNYYMNVSGTNTVDTVKGSPQILWFPNKNAFLAGNVHIGAVDSVGIYSTALGYRSVAMGRYSQAFGYRAKAYGDFSTSIGKYSVAGARSGGTSTASSSFAFGSGATATGDNSYAFGSGAIASGYLAFAFGSVGLNDSGNPTTIPTTANQPYTFAIGMGAQATAKGGLALGIGAAASGQYSNSLGYYSIASGTYSTAVGYKSTASNSNALSLGNGTVASGTNSTAMGYQSQAQGDKSIAIGSYYTYSYLVPIINLAKGPTPTGESKGSIELLPIRPLTPISTFTRSFSRANIASGQYSVAVGNGNLAQDGGLVFGSNSDAIKFGALALGTSAKANESNSVAIGYNTTAAGIYSMAIGNNVSANSYGELALGQWNETATGSISSWDENDLLFSVGNGVNDANRSNALTIYKNGSTILRGRYAVSTLNLKTARLFYNPITHLFYTRDYVYGMYTNLSRDDAAIEYYYSGYFTSTGTEGTYYGLYADKFTTADATITTLKSSGAYSTVIGSAYRDLYVDNTGLIGNLVSSERYKKDIEELIDINWLYDLRPVSYRYKTSDAKEKEMGLIAEEVLKINPNLVSFNENGVPETVVYSKLVAPLLKAVQDQKTTIDGLKSENEMLRERLEKLENVVLNLAKEEK